MNDWRLRARVDRLSKSCARPHQPPTTFTLRIGTVTFHALRFKIRTSLQRTWLVVNLLARRPLTSYSAKRKFRLESLGRFGFSNVREGARYFSKPVTRIRENRVEVGFRLDTQQASISWTPSINYSVSETENILFTLFTNYLLFKQCCKNKIHLFFLFDLSKLSLVSFL